MDEALTVRAREVLKRYFGYADFRRGQLDVVTAVVRGRDAMVVIPTGGGKSLCYQVPALVLGGLTVVLSPLISLMKDQVDALARRGIRASYLNSSLPALEQHERLVRVVRGEVDLLYVAPERLDNPGLLQRLRHVGVRLLAVDEAHCISEWGHEFRPAYRRIAALRTALGAPPTVALTATATPAVRSDIRRQLALRDPVIVVTGFDRPNLGYRVIHAKRAAEKRALLPPLVRGTEGAVVVYAATRRDVETMARTLRDSRLPALAYHAGLEPARRRKIQDAFLREERSIIVATSAFGMGIDKPNVRRVVHYAIPASLEAYYQEAGRAGRDGDPGDCVLLHCYADRFTHEFFIRTTLPERKLVERVHAVLRAAANGGPVAAITIEQLALLSGIGARAAAGALGVITRGKPPNGAGSAIASIRVLATPERVAAELRDHPLERALFEIAVTGARATGEARLALDALAPGFGGVAAAAGLLDGLQRRQFLMWTRVGTGIPVPDLDSVDWNLLDRRRRAECDRLDAMQRYTYTRGCRRSYVLRYFGDLSSTGSCGACDNCGRPSPAARRQPIR